MKTFKLHLIRHGLTQGNIDGIYMGGGTDMPLCDAGKERLQDLIRQYRYPGVGILFSSPMARAMETADILYPDLANKVILEDLRENVFGEFEGQKVADLMHNETFAQWLNPESDVTPKGGESGRVFAARVDRAFQSMLEHMIQNHISQAACVTHGGVIMSIMSKWALPKKSPAEWLTDNGCGFTVQTNTSMFMRDGFVETIAIQPEGYMGKL